MQVQEREEFQVQLTNITASFCCQKEKAVVLNVKVILQIMDAP